MRWLISLMKFVIIRREVNKRMSDNLDKVMDKLKKPKQDEKPKEETKEDQEIEELEDELEKEELEETKTTEKKVGKTSEKDKKGESKQPEKQEEPEEDAETTRLREITILQNDGVFRQELLIQLAKINENLYVLNSLVDKAVNGEQEGKKDPVKEE